ncbi:DUF2927 domain-containing protein [uncultured Croceitalea sp.]|uniref:DUF2927 domain-containing protein n=1 Tax=uncultured Croceitalea sp. TaxID=1798908 RepID=UPI00330581D2
MLNVKRQSGKNRPQEIKLNSKNILGKILLGIVILLGLLFYLKKRDINYDPTPYEKEIIDYFKEIALQSEFTDNPEKVIKWKESVFLYIVKEKGFKDQMSAIERTINEINQLATDGFKIEITENHTNSNIILYLCNKERVKELDPEFYKKFNDLTYDVAGFVNGEALPETYELNKAKIFINTENTIDGQESTILEEITQSLGLAFDSKKYPTSIFYEDKYKLEEETMQYSQLDKEIIRLLYHPKMKPGLDTNELDSVILGIFKSEKD